MKKKVLTIGVFMLVSSICAKELGQVKDNEGNVYQTVKIGQQEWLAQNLRSTKFQDGSKINTAFIPDDDKEKLLKYGRLYSWEDVADKRNICPIGWRVATDDDWKTLETTLGISQEDADKEGWRGDIAITLKASQSDTLLSKFEPSEVNRHKFSVKPAGIKWRDWYFVRGMYAEFWTGSEATKEKAYNRTFAHSWWNWHKSEIYRSNLSKEYMFSVRCVKIDR